MNKDKVAKRTKVDDIFPFLKANGVSIHAPDIIRFLLTFLDPVAIWRLRQTCKGLERLYLYDGIEIPDHDYCVVNFSHLCGRISYSVVALTFNDAFNSIIDYHSRKNNEGNLKICRIAYLKKIQGKKCVEDIDFLLVPGTEYPLDDYECVNFDIIPDGLGDCITDFFIVKDEPFKNSPYEKKILDFLKLNRSGLPKESLKALAVLHSPSPFVVNVDKMRHFAISSSVERFIDCQEQEYWNGPFSFDLYTFNYNEVKTPKTVYKTVEYDVYKNDDYPKGLKDLKEQRQRPPYWNLKWGDKRYYGERYLMVRAMVHPTQSYPYSAGFRTNYNDRNYRV